mgnify:CR=1 FL=1
MRIEDPATFTPPEWDREAGDKKEDPGMPMPRNKQVEQHAPPPRATPRNLVYVMRYTLPEPTKFLSITTIEPEDFIRFDVDPKTLPIYIGQQVDVFIKGEPVSSAFSGKPAAEAPKAPAAKGV